jgi:DNA-binding PadR family transcriptional regulator
MSVFPFLFKGGRMFGRGDFRYIVLNALQKRPMHGYEIMKVVGDKFSGFYAPSPGMVYPTLQMLEDEGYVKGRNYKGKKIYELTKEGRAFLKSNKNLANAGAKKVEEFFGAERMELLQEVRKLGKLVFLGLDDISPTQAAKITRIVRATRQRIAAVVQQW